LTGKKFKYSKKNIQILDILKSNKSLSANGIIYLLSKIIRATIYRNLTFFVKHEILRKVHIKEGASSFELNIKGNYNQHFICETYEK